jgi:hypothetical protein
MVSLPFENESGNLQQLAAGGADGIADCALVQVFYRKFTKISDKSYHQALSWMKSEYRPSSLFCKLCLETMHLA